MNNEVTGFKPSTVKNIIQPTLEQRKQIARVAAIKRRMLELMDIKDRINIQIAELEEELKSIS